MSETAEFLRVFVAPHLRRMAGSKATLEELRASLRAWAARMDPRPLRLVSQPGRPATLRKGPAT